MANKISFISTVFNEEGSIESFLNSILSQTIKPNEVVLVDGGSSDKTVARIKNYESRFKGKGINLRLMLKKGNIATGRNYAIKNAKNDIIICSDVGCILDKNWIKNIIKPFDDRKIDVVSGFYEPYVKNTFEKSLATYTCVMPDKLDRDNYLPSSRSIAFRKKAWKEVGGYPEWLDTCEDLYFARELKRRVFKIKFVQNAIVFWPQRKNFIEAFRQFYNYAIGDGMARYIRPNTPFLFIRYVIGMILLLMVVRTQSVALLILMCFLLLGYVLWSILKNYKYVQNPTAFIYLPLLQFTSDIAVISGMSIGFIRSLTLKKV